MDHVKTLCSLIRSQNVCVCASFSPLNVLLGLLYGCDGGLNQGNVLHLFIALCTLVWVSWTHELAS